MERCRALDLFGQSIGFSALPVVAPAAVLTEPEHPKPKPVAVARGTSAPRPRVETSVHVEKLLAYFGRQRAGVKMADVVAGMGGVSDFTLRPVLAALVADGRIVRTGATISLRYGFPAVMAQPSEPTAVVGRTGKPVRPSRLPENTTKAPWREAVLERLETGASYTREELIKLAQRVNAEVTGDMVITALEALVGEGKAARIPAGDTLRYQRRTSPRAKTA